MCCVTLSSSTCHSVSKGSLWPCSGELASESGFSWAVHLLSCVPASSQTTSPEWTPVLRLTHKMLGKVMSNSSSILHDCFMKIYSLNMNHLVSLQNLGFPGGTGSKEPACQCWRHKRQGSDPWVGKILWRMTTHSSILAWRIPWTEEVGGLQSMVSHRVGHDWSWLGTKLKF